jgi:ribosome-associated protein
MNAKKLQKIIIKNLEDNKAHKITDIADYMIIASGNSSRQLKALTKHLIEALKANEANFISVEGDNDSEWILIDSGYIIVHLMLPEVRKFYALEKLWSDFNN